MPITVEAKESAGLDVGAYEGVIVEMTEETGQYGEQIKFVIELDELKPNGENVTQWAWASKTLSPKSKLWKWVKGVTGQTPTIGGTFDVEGAMKGQRVGFLISMNENDRPGVTDMFKARGNGAAAAPAPQAARPAPGQGAPAAEAVGLICAVPKCGRPAFSYDEDGEAAICPKHGGLPE